jgi:hypothetical protein
MKGRCAKVIELERRKQEVTDVVIFASVLY